MNTDPRDPTPIVDSDGPPQHPDDDHKVAENPPIDDPDYQSEESFE